MQTPQEADPPVGGPLLPVNRMADASENITLPQTSFVGGNVQIVLVIGGS